MNMSPVKSISVSNPYSKFPSKPLAWLPLLFIATVTVACLSFSSHITVPPELIPYFRALLLLAWWAILSLVCLRVAGIAGSWGMLLRWLLSTPGINIAVLTSLAVGVFLANCFDSVLPVCCCLGLVWPIYLLAIKKARPFSWGRSLTLLTLSLYYSLAPLSVDRLYQDKVARDYRCR